MNRALIADFFDQTDLPQLLAELSERWEQEKKNRQSFYDWVQPDVKAEFINGEIVVHSPVKKMHNTAATKLFGLLSCFVTINDLGYLGYNKVMSRFTRNDYEPDICYFKKGKVGHMDEDDSIFPVPDFIVEITSKSTVTRDRGVKFEDYQNHGVGEYCIIDPDRQTLEQYLLENGKYQLRFSGNEGEVECHSIPGFRIPVEAIFSEEAHLRALKGL